MSNKAHFMKRLFQNLLYFIAVNGVAYLVISFLNWSLSIADWGGFSRLLMAIIWIVMVIATYSAMKTVVRNIKAKG